MPDAEIKVLTLRDCLVQEMFYAGDDELVLQLARTIAHKLGAAMIARADPDTHTEQADSLVYKSVLWALDKDGEKRAFAVAVEVAPEHLMQHPANWWAMYMRRFAATSVMRSAYGTPDKW